MLTGRTKVLAVFGYPVEHSLSPAMHNAAIQAMGLDYIYVPFRVNPADLPKALDAVRAMGFAGVNLTIPLKEVAVGLMDELSPQAARIGSVNTVWWNDCRLAGDSTDGEGFLRSLTAEVGQIPARALILGAGGSARAVCYALSDRGVKLVIANRTAEKAEKLAAELGNTKVKVTDFSADSLCRAAGESDLIINCTSVGMVPNPEESLLPSEAILKRHIVYDLVYNPPETLLLSDAKKKGARAINGLKMLAHQGALSFELWTGLTPPVNIMEQALEKSIL